MSRAVIALGANLGATGQTLRDAAAEIAALPGVRVVAASHEVESVALTLDGRDEHKPRYRNGIVIVETALEPRPLLELLHRIENAHGRVRVERWGDRTLDLDIVAVDDRIDSDPVVTLPHPRAAERDFVLAPWLDADPEAFLPGVGPVAEVLAAVGDQTVRVPGLRLVEPEAGVVPATTPSAEGRA
ncbi:2-amino-4-hydroxy-6-hydroxymethyldihydropteridine diphosphokinase [Curtobacterium ammoniigenes]|uniref:2-amino-4-hydroxy-6- hydroxymethyldihydropteridine diphosphokinase n=1 Tax=Curtobacterium ammoniigenes TaxID=395387 RepID=UPI000832A261|nr:2-amino-4-hydroxy-6-hydroxymethyldihydropteridine diphosphokinase [Curtobacterium ammoniigenes]